MMSTVTRIHVEGFRSVRKIDLELGHLTLLIGANGSGKSNLLWLLRMIRAMEAQSLRRFVGEAGGASALLHFGPKTTKEISIRVELQAAAYSARLGYAAGDSLLYLDEAIHERRDHSWLAASLGAGHYEARLIDTTTRRGSGSGAGFGDGTGDGSGSGSGAGFGDGTGDGSGSGSGAGFGDGTGDGSGSGSGAGFGDGRGDGFVPKTTRVTGLALRSALAGMSFYHFRDTSTLSPLRQNARQADDQELAADGGNLAAFLWRISRSESAKDVAAWTRISYLVRRVAPCVKALQPTLVDSANPATSAVRLLWTDERDHRFDVHALSDGSLRAIALIALLQQPVSQLPRLICIDEPELGLHPAAVNLLASIVSSVSTQAQILLATQSPALLDAFEPEQVVVAERKDGATDFRRLSPEALAPWLEDYSLSELFDKNVLGGRP